MNIVFDIGNVICEWSPEKLAARVFNSKKNRREAIEKIIFHEDWLKLDRGTLSLTEAIERSRSRLKLDRDKIVKLYQETPKTLTPIEDTIEIIQDLHEREYPLFILSNMHKHTFDYLESHLAVLKYFSGIVISSHVHAIKPELAIFKHLIDTYGIEPADTVFVDDMVINIEAAREFGFHTVLAQDISKMKNQLFRIIESNRIE